MSERDPVNPSYYNDLAIQPRDAIRDWDLNFNLGNVVKYVARAGKKDPAKLIEDLRKAEDYLRDEIANLAADECEIQDTVLDVIDRLSRTTGFDANKVMTTALNLYEDALDAKQEGNSVVVVDELGNDVFEFFGLFEGDDEPEVESETAVDPSKTVSCYRCAKCGMPIVAGTESKDKDVVNGSEVMFHFGCFPDDAKDSKPRLAVGDKVRFAGDTPTLHGYVREIKPADDRMVYVVDWSEQVDSETNRFRDEHWGSELELAEKPEPSAFKLGDRVRDMHTGETGVIHWLPNYYDVLWDGDDHPLMTHKSNIVHAEEK
jgi:hypothetical protein